MPIPTSMPKTQDKPNLSNSECNWIQEEPGNFIPCSFSYRRESVSNHRTSTFIPSQICRNNMRNAGCGSIPRIRLESTSTYTSLSIVRVSWVRSSSVAASYTFSSVCRNSPTPTRCGLLGMTRLDKVAFSALSVC